MQEIFSPPKTKSLSSVLAAPISAGRVASTDGNQQGVIGKDETCKRHIPNARQEPNDSLQHGHFRFGINIPSFLGRVVPHKQLPPSSSRLLGRVLTICLRKRPSATCGTTIVDVNLTFDLYVAVSLVNSSATSSWLHGGPRGYLMRPHGIEMCLWQILRHTTLRVQPRLLSKRRLVETSARRRAG